MRPITPAAAAVLALAPALSTGPAARADDRGPPPVRLIEDRPLGPGKAAFGPALSPDGTRALLLRPAGGGGGDPGFEVFVVAVADGKETARLPAVHGADLDDLAVTLLSAPFSRDGKRFAAFGAAGTLSVFRADEPDPATTREDVDRADIRGAAFARAEDRLLWIRYDAAARRAEVVARDLATGKVDVVARLPGARPLGLFLSPAGRLAATFRPAARGAAELVLVDLVRGEPVRTHALPDTELGIETALARFSADGRRVYFVESGALLALGVLPGAPPVPLSIDGAAPLPVTVAGLGEVVLFYGEKGLTAIAPDGGTQVHLADGEAVFFAAAGDLVAYYSDVRGGPRVARVVHLAPKEK